MMFKLEKEGKFTVVLCFEQDGEELGLRYRIQGHLYSVVVSRIVPKHRTQSEQFILLYTAYVFAFLVIGDLEVGTFISALDINHTLGDFN